MQPLNTHAYKSCVIKVYYDDDSTSPREWDNAGLMLCKHHKYNLGDNHSMSTYDITEYVQRPDVLQRPLFLLDHSGLWMRTSRFAEDSGGWDTSHVGYITITHKKAVEEWGKTRYTKAVEKQALACLEQEVKTYNDFLSGAGYGYVCETADGEKIDSCRGYFGDDVDSYMLDRAKEAIDHFLETRHDAHCEQLATAIEEES